MTFLGGGWVGIGFLYLFWFIRQELDFLPFLGTRAHLIYWLILTTIKIIANATPCFAWEKSLNKTELSFAKLNTA